MPPLGKISTITEQDDEDSEYKVPILTAREMRPSERPRKGQDPSNSSSSDTDESLPSYDSERAGEDASAGSTDEASPRNEKTPRPGSGETKTRSTASSLGSES